MVKNGLNAKKFRASGHFKWGQNNLMNEIGNGTYCLIKSKLFSIRYQKANKSYKIPSNIIDSQVGVGTNEDAKKELRSIGLVGSFDYAKPLSLIKYLVKWDSMKIKTFASWISLLVLVLRYRLLCN